MYLLEFHENSTYHYQTSNLFEGLEVALLTFSRYLEYREGDLDETFDEIDLIDDLLDALGSRRRERLMGGTRLLWSITYFSS